MLQTLQYCCELNFTDSRHENYRNGATWNEACFSPDGRYAAAGSIDGKLMVWNTASAKLESTVKSSQT